MRTTRRKMSPEEAALCEEFYLDVWALDKGRCRVTGFKAPVLASRLQRHHVIPKERLRRDGHPIAVIWDPDNGMLVDRNVHTRHTDAVERIPRSALPERALRFARRLGYMPEIERKYPNKEAT